MNMVESRRNSEWSPSDLTAVPTPISATPTLCLDINNPADLEAQLLRLKERRDSDNSDTSTSTQQSDQPISSDIDTPSHNKPKTLSTYLSHQISPSSKYIQTQFLLLSLATGIIDATTFPTYSLFISKQTGNTILLALIALPNTEISTTEPIVILSISLFFLSAILFGHIGHSVTASSCSRLWLLVSNLISTTLVFSAAALRFFAPNDTTGSVAMAVVSCLSVGMAAQVTLAFALKIPDINTTMITGALVQFAIDNKVLDRQNEARDRRAAFFVAMLVGAFVGAACVGEVDAWVGLVVAGAVKGVVTIMFLF